MNPIKITSSVISRVDQVGGISTFDPKEKLCLAAVIALFMLDVKRKFFLGLSSPLSMSFWKCFLCNFCEN